MNSTDQAGLLRDDQWRAGYARLAEHGLSFDAMIYHHPLHDLATLATDFPEVPLVLDHAGTPPAVAGPYGGLGTDAAERHQVMGEWRDGISRLAECGHVTTKVSGLAMPVTGFGCHTRAAPPSVTEVADDMEPFVAHLELAHPIQDYSPLADLSEREPEDMGLFHSQTNLFLTNQVEINIRIYDTMAGVYETPSEHYGLCERE